VVEKNKTQGSDYSNPAETNRMNNQKITQQDIDNLPDGEYMDGDPLCDECIPFGYCKMQLEKEMIKEVMREDSDSEILETLVKK